MPLITITGTPCSGKTYRARQILAEFQARIPPESTISVVYLPSYHASQDPPLSASDSSDSDTVPDESHNPRDVIYESARLEKIARAEEFSAIKRALNKNTVVIADSPNYIKGFRYQLHCEAKAANTRSVVVHTASRQDECERWNDERLAAWGRSLTSQELQVAEGGSLGESSRVGKDVLGELEPESHTAIYGDTLYNGSRSRTSSTGAAAEEEGEGSGNMTGNRRADDTMTLKSLYITDQHDLSTAREEVSPAQRASVQIDSNQSTRDLPDSTPPRAQSSLAYSPSIFKSLFMRYEPPSPFTRWDTPLFTIPSTDAHPPYDEIWTALFPASAKPTSKKALLRERQERERQEQERAAKEDVTPQVNTAQQLPQISSVRQNAATVLPSATNPNALQTLESTTGDIAKLVLAAARDLGVAEGEDHAVLSITLPNIDGENLTLEMEKQEGVALSQPKLQRLRRKFGQIQRGGIAHGQGHAVGRRAVAVEFARFLEGEWAIEGRLAE